eukprot:CAMPEP_0170195528 /NCGR_PEP_ID=MMETSP0040_2-20121228/61703_1 /TAXON_ID=641309 /ORGANISM="Lotharella oceanica, Strain CCMP622" /LENGTH=115 /DNA_ID=CAMNT_0010444713 /DNA_START=68 /DNA_END=415 /DNA_ORIENTATION=-
MRYASVATLISGVAFVIIYGWMAVLVLVQALSVNREANEGIMRALNRAKSGSASAEASEVKLWASFDATIRWIEKEEGSLHVAFFGVPVPSWLPVMVLVALLGLSATAIALMVLL